MFFNIPARCQLSDPNPPNRSEEVLAGIWFFMKVWVMFQQVKNEIFISVALQSVTVMSASIEWVKWRCQLFVIKGLDF